MYLIPRFFYWLIGTSLFVGLVAQFIRLIGLFGGENYETLLLGKLGAVTVWPRNKRLWVNLYLSRLRYRVQQRLRGDRSYLSQKPLNKSKNGRMQIGVIGPLVGLLGFPKELFESKPPDVELSFFDIQYTGKQAFYLQSLSKRYKAYDLDAANGYHEEIERVGCDINQSDLDLLLNVYYWKPVYDILNLCESSCIVNVCTNSDLVHHEKINFHLYPQPEADFFIEDNRIFCGLTRQYFYDDVVYPGFIYYDPRDIEIDERASWSTREKLIVFHGSLYKMTSHPYLSVIFNLMVDDGEIEFVFMGRGKEDLLARIQGWAKEKGVESRVHYEGQFSPVRNNEGFIDDPNWQKLKGFLRKSRLAPNPWPVGGGSARVEAYLSGAPTVHMAVRFDPDIWGKSQFSLVELPDLLIEKGTARTPESYRDLCRKCLYDEAFADSLSSEQLRVAKKVTDPAAWWRQILDCYQDWLVKQ